MTPHTHEYEFSPLPPGALALRVRDVAEAKSKLEAAGVQVNDMWDSGKCRGAGVHDPSGNPILLHRRYAPYPAASELPPTGPVRRVVRRMVLGIHNRRRRSAAPDLKVLEG